MEHAAAATSGLAAELSELGQEHCCTRRTVHRRPHLQAHLDAQVVDQGIAGAAVPGTAPQAQDQGLCGLMELCSSAADVQAMPGEEGVEGRQGADSHTAVLPAKRHCLGLGFGSGHSCAALVRAPSAGRGQAAGREHGLATPSGRRTHRVARHLHACWQMLCLLWRHAQLAPLS